MEECRSAGNRERKRGGDEDNRQDHHHPIHVLPQSEASVDGPEASAPSSGHDSTQLKQAVHSSLHTNLFFVTRMELGQARSQRPHKVHPASSRRTPTGHAREIRHSSAPYGHRYRRQKFLMNRESTVRTRRTVSRGHALRICAQGGQEAPGPQSVAAAVVGPYPAGDQVTPQLPAFPRPEQGTPNNLDNLLPAKSKV